MAIRLIALDIDGTLTNTPNEISSENLLAIRRAEEAGVIVTVATGRGCCATRRIWSLMNLKNYAIQFGGAWIVDTRDESTLYMDALSHEIVQHVLRYADELGQCALIYQGDTVFCKTAHPFALRYTQRGGMPFVVEPDICNRVFHGVPKVLVYADPSEEDAIRAKITAHLDGLASVSRSSPGFIEINGLSANKGHALSILAKHLGIAQRETAALGDSYLDMPMMQWAGIGACVSDGVEDAKAVADVIIPPCDENGVAHFIERYVLG